MLGKQDLIKNGFVNKSVDSNLNLEKEIQKLKKEKDAVILAHYYQTGDIQDIADFVGDSLALSQEAEKIESQTILFAGVHFMAETTKILTPDKKVLIPDLNAGCSLADSCPYDEFKNFVQQHPDHIVVSYVNTTAKIKTLTDICCTSTNALQIINYLPKDQKIIFAPDKNLGNYIKRITGRENMVIWDGACHVHEEFSLEKIIELKNQNPDAKVIVHPECEKPVQVIADHIGSTSSLLKYTIESNAKKFIVGTESGIIHQMKKSNPDKEFIVAPSKDSSCGCNDCNFMKIITMKKIYNTLLYEIPEVILDDETIRKAKKSIENMLDISKKLGL